MQINLSQLTEIKDHQGAVKEIKVHMSGKFFVSRSDAMMLIHSLEDYKKLQGFYDGAGYAAIAFSPDYSTLLYETDEKIHYFDLGKWQEVMVVSGKMIERRDMDVHSGAGLIADGNEQGRIKIMKIGSDDYTEPEMILEGHKNYIEYVCFHPNGKILASGSADKTIRFWDLSDGSEISCHEVHDDFVTAIAFSHDGKFMVSGDYSGTIKVFEVSG